MVLGSDFYLGRVASEEILPLWLAAWRDQIIMMGKARREHEEASHAAATLRKHRERSAGWSSGFLISPIFIQSGLQAHGMTSSVFEWVFHPQFNLSLSLSCNRKHTHSFKGLQSLHNPYYLRFTFFWDSVTHNCEPPVKSKNNTLAQRT